MKLFSWFIKANKQVKAAQEELSTITTEVVIKTTDEEMKTFNNNTMWPIAKVKTTTMIIKKPNKKMNTSQSTKKYETNTKGAKPFIITIPLG
ncbi:hypothetical protein [Colwellia hornerae]|uniref:Uncharacterized protein n=1 Tax=Colwellia hornerae TaxID=89402 RepID=A0A5C6Q3U7_9GAMM|nr:hypothetical protein [Colwellia hornerae]TWX56192.1 hypothetical protein ESZ28_04655 [Colwellia hornerae]TWX62043.1 hypothetical protein ESZ26_03430 [Colwellia hornerae]TWX63519.1 hypothetical protein ESZ27_16490 [Colwellia hornerae]